MPRALVSSIFLFIVFTCDGQLPSDAPSAQIFYIDSNYFQSYWSGDLVYNNYDIPIGFDIQKDKITFDNPAQGRVKIAVDSFHTLNDGLLIFISHLKFKMTPVFAGEVVCSLNDQSETHDFRLFRDRQLSALKRPQTPNPTEDYLAEEITFQNPLGGISFSGTLTRPSGIPFSGAILLTGSGPQDRDETILGHKPFAVIADRLSRSGMVILRYDDRGTGLSEGAHSFATSYDFATDAAAAFAFLKNQYPQMPIGFIGHSEGGIIAQVADSLVEGADFHIYLAGPGLDIVDLMLEQNALVLAKQMSSKSVEIYVRGLAAVFNCLAGKEEISQKQPRLNHLTKELYNSLPPEDAKKIAPSDFIYSMSFSQLMYLKWWPYFISYQPRQYLRQIACPILALNGEKDIQVTPANLNPIKKYATRSEVTTVLLEGTNHLFQRCSSCTIGEYGMLIETFSPVALDSIESWLTRYKLIGN